MGDETALNWRSGFIFSWKITIDMKVNDFEDWGVEVRMVSVSWVWCHIESSVEVSCHMDNCVFFSVWCKFWLVRLLLKEELYMLLQPLPHPYIHTNALTQTTANTYTHSLAYVRACVFVCVFLHITEWKDDSIDKDINKYVERLLNRAGKEGNGKQMCCILNVELIPWII